MISASPAVAILRASPASSLFSREANPFGLGEGCLQPRTKQPFTAPVAILVNARTRGSAEHSPPRCAMEESGGDRGNQTAGEASLLPGFHVTSGACFTPRGGSGSGRRRSGGLPVRGLNPDIRVATPVDAGHRYVLEPYAPSPQRRPDPPPMPRIPLQQIPDAAG